MLCSTRSLDVPGFRRLTQAWALRRLWGPQIGLRAGAVFLREDEANPGLRKLDTGTLVRFDQRLRATAARLLEVELGEAAGAVPWPKLDTSAACGTCVHVGAGASTRLARTKRAQTIYRSVPRRSPDLRRVWKYLDSSVRANLKQIEDRFFERRSAVDDTDPRGDWEHIRQGKPQQPNLQRSAPG
ncbi:hypothetical protein ENSA7_59610 [Enhygromyxa salina]|uniref:Uncharacterized protein n=2 Tax=Enhygromyxa salina TaxID=215803 RepID=A0A2S9Y5T2_9BACT|nr:hypothetical protein ENSA7_59610 [Enhygromyxa salina]